MTILLYIYLAIGFILWNIGMNKDEEIRGWDFLKGLGFMIFTTFCWLPVIIGYYLFKRD